MRTSTAMRDRLTARMLITARVVAACLACGVAWGQHYTYGENAEFGTSRLVGANLTSSSTINGTDDAFSIRFTALEDATIDRIHVRYSLNNTTVSFTVGIMADNGAGSPDGSYMVSVSTNLSKPSVGLQMFTPEITFGSSLTLTNGSVYHIVTQPTSFDLGSDFRLNYGGTAADVRPFDLGYDPMQNVLRKLNGGAWAVENWTPWFLLAYGSSTGYILGPGQAYNAFYQNLVDMAGGGSGKQRGQTFVITDKEIPLGATVSITQAVVNIYKAASVTVTNDLLVQLRDSDSPPTLLGTATVPNGAFNASANSATAFQTVDFTTPVILEQGHKYLLAFEFSGPPPATATDKIIIQELRAVGYTEISWGGGTDGVLVESSDNWTSYAPTTLWDGYDLRVGLKGTVGARPPRGTVIMLR